MKSQNKRNKIGTLPREAIFLGVAEDGLPVLFNTADKSSPNIMVWDKTPKQGLRLLKVIADYLLHSHQGNRVEFLVLTRFPEDWGELNKYGMGYNGDTSCIGIIPFYSDLASRFIGHLCSWIENQNIAKNPIIILIDGIENVNHSSDKFQECFTKILFTGRMRSIYVVGTSKMKYYEEIKFWLRGFQHDIQGSDVENVFQMLESKDTEYERTIRFTTEV